MESEDWCNDCGHGESICWKCHGCADCHIERKKKGKCDASVLFAEKGGFV